MKQYAIAFAFVAGVLGLVIGLAIFAPWVLVGLLVVAAAALFTYMVRDVLEWNGFFDTKEDKAESAALQERMHFSVTLAKAFMEEDRARDRNPSHTWRTPEDIESEIRVSMDYWGPR